MNISIVGLNTSFPRRRESKFRGLALNLGSRLRGNDVDCKFLQFVHTLYVSG